MTEVFLTRRTIHDLIEIEQHSIKEWGDVQAKAYLKSIQESLSLIAQHPELLKKKQTISNQFKVYNVNKHWLICDITVNHIYVLAIKHISLNLLEQLKELSPSLDAEAKALSKRLKTKK